MINAAIFDLNGTLVDSDDLRVQAWQETSVAARRMSHCVGEKVRGHLDFFSAIASRQTNLSCDQKF
jgi:beta-phosphoglucomutase-like phosphatase (HAD superfamily)